MKKGIVREDGESRREKWRERERECEKEKI